jgi:hypothetical protein
MRLVSCVMGFYESGASSELFSNVRSPFLRRYGASATNMRSTI